MSTRPPRLPAALGSLAVLVGLVVATPVAAATSARADPPSPDARHKLLLLFDSSGSMKDPDANGSTKIDAARDAFAKLIPRLPPTGQVGLRVYGATIFDKRSPGACTDSQLAVPIGPADRAALGRAVAGFRPYGETPISYSLQQGAKDLGPTGKRTILLVSDGEETCDPDPCATAREIAGLGIDLKIDVVGFRIDAKARDQLRCIADAGSGTFYETDDADTLAASLHRLSVRAFRPFRVSGRAVNGTSVAGMAPVVGAGQYVDTAPPRGETRFYRVRRSMKGSTLHIGASARPAPGTSVSSLQLETKTLAGDSCGYGLGTEVTYARTNPVVTASASSWDEFTAYRRTCQDDRELLVALAQSTSSGGTLDDVPVELVVIEEPPVDAEEDLLPQAESRPAWTDPRGGRARPVTAGASFSDAPLVRPGRYHSSLFPGEVQFFKVRLGWGQRLQAEVRTPKPSRKLAGLTDNPQVLDLELISATRGKAQATLSAVAGQDRAFVDDTAAARARTTTVETRYANREAGSSSQRSVALAGDYYLAVALGEDVEGQSYLLPVDVVIGVYGDAGKGAPVYAGGQAVLVPGPDGRATEFRPVSGGGADVGRTTGGEPVADAGGARSAAESPFGPISRGRGTAVVALSAIAVGLGAAAAVRGFRRRRRREPGN